MLKVVIVLCLALVAFVNGNGLEFQNCGRISDVSARLDSCTVLPCKIFAGRNHTINIDFKSNQFTRTMNFEFMVKVSNSTEFSNVKFGSFCNYLVGGTCPLFKGTKYHIKFSTVLPKYLHTHGRVMTGALIVRNDDNKIMLCGQVPILVVEMNSAAKFSRI